MKRICSMQYSCIFTMQYVYLQCNIHICLGLYFIRGESRGKNILLRFIQIIHITKGICPKFAYKITVDDNT